MHSIPVRAAVGVALLAGVLLGPLHAQEPAPSAEALKEAFPAQKSYSPYAGRNFPTQVYWGDTHLHTGASMDAGAFGARLGPADAYRFARGEEVTAANGMRVQARAAARLPGGRRPLRQHGLLPRSSSPAIPTSSPIRPASAGTTWSRRAATGRSRWRLEVIDSFSKGTFPPALASAPGTPAYRSAWETDDQGGRGVQRPRSFHRLHRLRVDLATPAATTCTASSSSATAPTRRARSSPTPRSAGGQRRPQGPVEGARRPTRTRPAASVLAIAHNGNLSNGIMFPIDRLLHRQAAHPRVRRDPRALGAALRGDADQGRRRGAPVPLAQRRARRLRALGQVQPQHERAQGANEHAPVRVRPHRAPDRPRSSSRSSASIPTSSA